MDSFYDQPRKAPIPSGLRTTTAQNMLPMQIPSNSVPDASLLLQNKGNMPQKRAEMSYNAWKYQLRSGSHASNKENHAIQSKDSILRKTVRFETPQTSNNAPHVPNFNVLPTRPSLINKQMPQILPKAVKQPQVPHTGEFRDLPRTENKILQAKPFEKLYLANVPNRNLDLSIIEPSRNLNHFNLHRSNSAPDRFHDIVTQKPVFYTEGNNELRKPIAESTTFELRKQFNDRNIDRIHEENEEKPSKETEMNDEPSVKDLLKIIQQQNEQLMCLQSQVTTLLKERSATPQIEANSNWQQPVFKNKIFDNVLQNPSQQMSPRPGKFAIDVMTSFEVSIRAPSTNRFNTKRFGGFNDENGAKITEILDESAKNSSKTDISLKLDEPVIVNERCPSPENSVHVDMKDFSSDDEEDKQNEDFDNSMIGWTIYNNVMDQVNFMLKKSTQKQHNELQSTQSAQAINKNQEFTGAIMKEVKEATLKHLQSVGVDLQNIEDDITISTEAAYTPSQVSFAVKQLLMKYLPDEQLMKLGGKTINAKPQANTLKNANYPKNLIKRRPDFSMATVQYMQKYNLLNCDQQTPQIFSEKHKIQGTTDKMLDITALKQQPKLL